MTSASQVLMLDTTEDADRIRLHPWNSWLRLLLANLRVDQVVRLAHDLDRVIGK